MIRENQKYITYLQIILDTVSVVLAFLLSFYLRFYSPFFETQIIAISFSQSFTVIITIVPVLIASYHLMRLYGSQKTPSIFSEMTSIIKSNTLILLVLIVALYIFKIVDFSRFLLALFYVINIVITFIERLGVRAMIRNYREKGYYLKNCLLIGFNEMSMDFISGMDESLEFGYQIKGFLDDYVNLDDLSPVLKSLKLRHDKRFNANYIRQNYKGKISDLDRLLNKKDIDIVIIGLSDIEYDKLAKILSITEKQGVKAKIIPYYYKLVPAKPYMDDIGGIPVIDTRHVPLDNVIRALSKRLFDIIISVIGIVLTSPIMVFSILMIKLTSPGPVIYKQSRVGLNRKSFMMYKFRSMKLQTENEEKTGWTTKDDPRKTRWGAFMRKTSIDELPQLFNVLKGDMSVIGPRPERPQFVEQFKETIPKYMIKHQVRPGITGWAQVNGWRGDTSIEKRIEYDLYYIENWTFGFDLKIILLTFFKGFINKNAY